MNDLIQLMIILISTALLTNFFTSHHKPSVVGKLLVGIILGPAVFNIVNHNELIDMFAEIGLILIMFTAGLESNLDKLKKYFKPSFSVAILGVIVPIVLSYLIAIVFGFSNIEAIFIGIVLCATSISITIQVLKDMDKLDTIESSIVLGAAVIDDVISITIIGFISGMFDSTSESFSVSLIKKVLFFIIVALLTKYIVPKLIQKSSVLKIDEAVLTAGILVCILFTYFAIYMGVGSAIGAFFAGLAVNQTKYAKEIETKISPTAYALFIPIFFISIGLDMSFDGLGLFEIGFAITLVIIAIISKQYGGFIGAKLMKLSNLSANIIGAGMISRGEMALIIAKIGFSYSILNSTDYSTLILVIIITTIIAPFILKHFLSKAE